MYGINALNFLYIDEFEIENISFNIIIHLSDNFCVNCLLFGISIFNYSQISSEEPHYSYLVLRRIYSEK